MPASATMRSVSRRDSHVWVVTTFGKNDRAVSRLWLYRCTPAALSRSTCSWVRIPTEAATSISTAALMAATACSSWFMSRSSGPLTAATMQNSVAPDFWVCLAASTSPAMSSQADRTGDSNRPDWEQKWQSSGQPPVFSEIMPSASISSPHHFRRTWWANSRISVMRSSPSCRTWRVSPWSRPIPWSKTLVRASSKISVGFADSVRGMRVSLHS